MASTKITNLAALSAPAPNDILVIVDDPSGTAATRKVTVADLFGNTSGSLALQTNTIIINDKRTEPANNSATTISQGGMFYTANAVYMATVANTPRRIYSYEFDTDSLYPPLESAITSSNTGALAYINSDVRLDRLNTVTIDTIAIPSVIKYTPHITGASTANCSPIGDTSTINVSVGTTISFKLVGDAQGSQNNYTASILNSGSAAYSNSLIQHVTTSGAITTGSGSQGLNTGTLYFHAVEAGNNTLRITRTANSQEIDITLVVS